MRDSNLGKIDVKGWELNLSWRDKIGNVNYNLGFNLDVYKRQIIFHCFDTAISSGIRIAVVINRLCWIMGKCLHKKMCIRDS